MTWMTRVADYFGLRADDTPSGVTPPPRPTGSVVTPGSAVTIGTVYRALEVHATAAMQLSIDTERRDETIPSSTLVRTPDVNMSRSDWIEYSIMSLALHGNAYWRHDRNPAGDIINLTPLDPNLCIPAFTNRDKTRRVVQHDGQTLQVGRDITHVRKMTIPGVAAGLGPIQAARVELGGALDLRDFSATWFQRGDIPPAILTTDATLTGPQIADVKTRWKDTADGGIRVLSHGLSYSPIMLNPADAQFLENKQFTTTEIARLLGIPASLMLAAIEGTSSTYSNVEQDWIAYVRFSLMSYLRRIETALTACLPRGQEARFNVEALLRTDTKTRYEAHKVALEAGFKTINEVRRDERMPPLPATQETHA